MEPERRPTGATPSNRTNPRLLLAEDDRAVRDAVVRVLRVEGYDVDAVSDGAQALSRVASTRPDLAVVDVMLPHVDGLSLCRTLRQRGDRLPVLLLTARASVADRVAGLDAGADDYLPKPFAIDELLARVRALLRRADPSGGADTLVVADLRIDRAGRTVSRADQHLDLTKTEFDLLELMALNLGVVLTRDVIYERIWGFDFETSSRSLDVYIGYLRRKVDPPGTASLIHTVRGVGYVMRSPAFAHA